MITLHENEQIVSTNRKVWMVFAATYSSAFLLLLLPFLVVPTLGALFAPLRHSPFLGILILSSTFWMWGVWVWLFWTLVGFYLDMLIVTNERLVHVEQKGVFNRTVSEIRLSRIQDITVTIDGVLPTFLHYGDIKIQSAAEVEEFNFTQVRFPEQLKELIMTEQRYAVAHEQNLTRPSE